MPTQGRKEKEKKTLSLSLSNFKLIQSGHTPTCFGGGHHHHQGIHCVRYNTTVTTVCLVMHSHKNQLGRY
jgi:hypothetical protein